MNIDQQRKLVSKPLVIIISSLLLIGWGTLFVVIFFPEQDLFINRQVYTYRIEQSSLPLRSLWTFAADEDLMVPAVIHGETAVYLRTSKMVYALHPQTGELRWRRPLKTAVEPPLTYEEYVYFLDPQHEGIEAIDALTGETAWRLDPGQYTKARTFTMPAQIRFYQIDQGTLYLAISLSKGTDILRVDPKTGRVLGEVPAVITQPDISPNAFYVGSEWVAVEMKDTWILSKDLSQVLQKHPGVVVSHREPTFANDIIYANGENVRSIALPDYREKWRFEHDCRWPGEMLSNSPIVFESYVYLIASCGKIYKVETQAGQAIWNGKTPQRDVRSFTVFDDTGYVVSQEATLTAIDLQSGDVLGELEMSPALTAKRAWNYLASSDDLLVVTWGNSEAFAFSTSVGKN